MSKTSREEEGGVRGRLRKLGLGRKADDEEDSPTQGKKKAKAKRTAASDLGQPPRTERSHGGDGGPEDDRPPEHESTGPKALREIDNEELEKILEAHREWIASKSAQGTRAALSKRTCARPTCAKRRLNPPA